ncbi:MAG: hypothetical protein AAF944_01680 [Bacteroidota bacterium]
MKYLLLLTALVLSLWYENTSEEKAFEIYYQDSIKVEVQLHYQTEQRPEYYVAHVTTPVCKEGLCHILIVDLYWDLLGNFMRYELPPQRPLTKFDHEEFSEADYAKLDKILADEYSLLGDHALGDLVDESTELVSEEVDAVTGATMKSVENTVVSGAVYTTYALWHLVNGEIAQRIPQHTQSLWNEELLQQFLQSDQYPYHYYALDHLSDEQFAYYLPQVMRLMEESSVFVSRYAIQKFPEALGQDSVAQLVLTEQFPEADFTTQNLILEKLAPVPLHTSSLEVLSQPLEQLSEQQLKTVLDLLQKNAQNLSEESLLHLTDLLGHTNPAYARLAYQTVQSLSQQYHHLTNTLHNYETANAKP